MENWMQKYENREEKTYEDMLNDKLNRLLDLVDISREYSEDDMLVALNNIVELYEKIQKSGFDYDKNDMTFRKKQLAELKYRKLKKEHMESRESDSWNEFEKEEREVEDEER